MYTTKEDLLAGLAVTLIARERKLDKKRLKRKWCKQWLLQRDQFSHINLLSELRLESNDWFNYLRMDEERYRNLLSLVTPLIEKQDTCMRKAISPHERLTATLRFLATGRSYEDMKFSTIISPQALSAVIPETCQAIYRALYKNFMKVSTLLKLPKMRNQWNAV